MITTPKSTLPSPWRATQHGDCIAIESADARPLALLVWHEHTEAAELWEAAQLMACAREMRDALNQIAIMSSFPSSGAVDNADNAGNLRCAIQLAKDALAQVKGGAK